MTTHAAPMNHPERRALHAGLAAAALTIFVLVAMVVASRSGGGTSAPSDPFTRRVSSMTSCSKLAAEWDDHHTAYEVTGSRESLRRQQVVHDREMKIGC